MSIMRLKYARVHAARWLTTQQITEIMRDAAAALERGTGTGQGTNRKSGKKGPRVTSGPHLAPGHLSRGEYMDFHLREPVTATAFIERLGPRLPAGLECRWARRLRPNAPSIKAAITELHYRVHGPFDATRLGPFDNAAAWPMLRYKKGRTKTVDLKQSVARIQIVPGYLDVAIRVLPAGVVKPEEAVASILGLEWAEVMLLPVERLGMRVGSIPAPA